MLAVATASQPIIGLLVAVVLIAISLPMFRKLTDKVGGSWLMKVLVISLLLHLIAAPMQIWVVDHFYGGIADWLRYDNQGSSLAAGFRHFDFSLGPGHLRGIVGDGSVSIMAGVVFAIVGTNQVAAFLVFGWLAFLGLLLFFRAFLITFDGAGYRRYAVLIFFLPSLIFWTADVSKEAVMTLALGLIAFGAAKFMVREPGGLFPIVVGAVIAAWVRPNELLLVVAGAVVAIMIMPSAAKRRNFSGLRRFLQFVFMSIVLGVALFLTVHYLHGKGGSIDLNKISQNNSGHGSSVVGYSSSPAAYPKDAYTVLFDPLPINAHGKGELLAAVENMILIGVIFGSFRQLRVLVRASFARPYVMMCGIYSAAFLYAFAALGDLGLITRERTLLFPFMMVLLAIPRTPKGKRPRYEWEFRRRARKARRRRARLGSPALRAPARPAYAGPPNGRPPRGRPPGSRPTGTRPTGGRPGARRPVPAGNGHRGPRR